MSGQCQVISNTNFGAVMCGADNALFGWVHVVVEGARKDRIMVCEFHFRAAQEMGLPATEIGGEPAPRPGCV